MMTPGQAKRALRLHWEARLGDAPHHLAVIVDALKTIAALRWKYAVQVVRDGVWVIDGDSYWGSYSVALARYGRAEGPARIVRRLVSDLEVVE